MGGGPGGKAWEEAPFDQNTKNTLDNLPDEAKRMIAHLVRVSNSK